MAKLSGPSREMLKQEHEYMTRDDVDKLMRPTKVCQDPKRYKRAVGRLTGTVKRLTGKRYGRSRSR